MKINNPSKLLALLATASVAATASFAQVTSDVVGYVTFSVPDSTDAKFGIPMNSASEAHAVSSVTSGTITTTTDVSSASTTNYIQFTSGSLSGEWFQVSSSSSNTLTVADDLESLGVTASDSFEILEFWTLSNLLGTSFTASTDIFSPIAQVILNDVDAVGINKAPTYNYAYHDGSSGFISAGWFDSSNPFGGSADDVLLAPNSFITVRNESGSTIDIVIAGSVPSNAINFRITADSSTSNDVLVFNPYPSDLTLSSSNLQDVIAVSTDIFSPAEQIIVYDSTDTGLNPSPRFNYAYHDGSSGFISAGWFDTSNPFGGSQDSVTIPAGGAFVVRKAAGGSDASWNAALPYSL